jgi:hypothetical protein
MSSESTEDLSSRTQIPLRMSTQHRYNFFYAQLKSRQNG